MAETSWYLLFFSLILCFIFEVCFYLFILTTIVHSWMIDSCCLLVLYMIPLWRFRVSFFFTLRNTIQLKCNLGVRNIFTPMDRLFTDVLYLFFSPFTLYKQCDVFRDCNLVSVKRLCFAVCLSSDLEILPLSSGRKPPVKANSKINTAWQGEKIMSSFEVLASSKPWNIHGTSTASILFAT